MAAVVAQARVRDLRVRKVTPHIARNEQISDDGTLRRRSAIDGRTTRHPGYAVSRLNPRRS